MPKATADDHGPTVSIVSWSLLVATLMTVIARTGMKWFLTHKMLPDDVIILAGSAFAIGQTAAITAGAVPNGLGRHAIQRTASQDDLFQKSYYAAVLLYIPCLLSSKMTVLFLLWKTTPIQKHRQFIRVVGVLSVAWAVGAEMAMAFQCNLPSPWGIFRGQCVNITAFWYCFGFSQLVLDVALVILPWLIVRPLQMSQYRKNVIVCTFGSRLIVIVGVVSQLVFFHSATRSDDVPYNLWSEIICAQVVQSLSIITACIPHLGPFFDSLEPGRIRTDDSRRQALACSSVYTPARSRQSSLQQTWPIDSTRETIELNARLGGLPNRSCQTTSGVIPIGYRVSQQPGRSTQPRQKNAIASNTISLGAQPHNSADEICWVEAGRKPSKA